MSDLYNVSTSPHVRSSATTQRIMLDVAIALVPAGAFGIYRFGIKALVLMLVCIAAMWTLSQTPTKYANAVRMTVKTGRKR